MVIYESLKSKYEKLGIEYTLDLKEVKRAYSKKIATCHPEENQEEWTKIHNAYIDIKNHIDSVNKKPGSTIDDKIKEIKKLNKEKNIGNNTEKPINKDSEVNTQNQKVAPQKDIPSKETLQEEIPIVINNNEQTKLEPDPKPEPELEKLDEPFILTLNQELEQISIEEQAHEEYEKYKSIISMLKKLISKNVFSDNSKVILKDSFMSLHNSDLYDDAMTYPIFVSKLAGVFSSAIPEPDIVEIIEEDIKKAEKRFSDDERKPNYEYLRKSVHKNEISSKMFINKREHRNQKQVRMEAEHRKSYNTSYESVDFGRLIFLVATLIMILIRCAR